MTAIKAHRGKREPWWKRIPKRPHAWKRRWGPGGMGPAVPTRYWDCQRPGCGEFFYDMHSPAKQRSGPWAHRGTSECKGGRDATK